MRHHHRHHQQGHWTNKWLLYGLVLAVLFGTPRPAAAQLEQVNITLPTSLSFTVTDSHASTLGTPNPTQGSYTVILVLPLRVLRISVIADTQNSVGPGDQKITAADVSWTVTNATGGTGSGGTLSASSFQQVFQSTLLPVTGAFDVHWTLAPPGQSVRAGVHTLTLRWRIESVVP